MAEPQSAPLTCLEEVIKWSEEDVDSCLLSSIKLQNRASNESWKCLVCHDMRNGYLHDRFVQGTGESNAYRFFHWSCIDIFVYFSHQFITIPPATWIDAAHLHGVRILGTVITEWTDGKKCCEELLDNRDTIDRFIDKLIRITIKFDFDGWLINIENEINEDDINNLKYLIQKLSDRLHRVRERSLVIWYDSVTNGGKLDWKNKLDDCNRCFFDRCDGIYLNYNWKSEELKQSLCLSGCRKHDVYAGIDVFGRGTVGGGGFNTKVPLQMAREMDLSIAIFAPGWVYEILGEQQFTNKEYEFWHRLLDKLPTHGPTSLPFATSFCQGYGNRFHHRGKIVDSSRWHNLSLQQHQPTITERSMKINTDDAFEGGGCLRIAGGSGDTDFGLFTCRFELDEPVYVTYVLKKPSEVNVRLILNDSRANYDCRSAKTEETNGWECRTFRIDELTTITAVRLAVEAESSFDFFLGYFQIAPVSRAATGVRLSVCRESALLTWESSEEVASFNPTYAVFKRNSDGDLVYLATTRKNVFFLGGDGGDGFVVEPRIFGVKFGN